MQLLYKHDNEIFCLAEVPLVSDSSTVVLWDWVLNLCHVPERHWSHYVTHTLASTQPGWLWMDTRSLIVFRIEHLLCKWTPSMCRHCWDIPASNRQLLIFVRDTELQSWWHNDRTTGPMGIEILTCTKISQLSKQPVWMIPQTNPVARVIWCCFSSPLTSSQEEAEVIGAFGLTCKPNNQFSHWWMPSILQLFPAD